MKAIHGFENDLGEILGHGRKACEALVPDTPEKLAESLLGYLWSVHRPAMTRMIFIDLLFEARAGDRSEEKRPGFAGFIAFRRSVNGDNRFLLGYLDLLEALLHDKITVGSHEVFQHSLPVYSLPGGQDVRPQTATELRNFRNQGAVPIREYYLRANLAGVISRNFADCSQSKWDSCFSSRPILSNKPLSENHSASNKPFYQGTYAEWQEACSNHPLADNWKLYITKLEDWLRNDVTQAEGGSATDDLAIWGIPIALASAEDHVGVGGLFLGFCPTNFDEAAIREVCTSIATSAFRVGMHRRALQAVLRADEATQIAFLPIQEWRKLRSKLRNVCQSLRQKAEKSELESIVDTLAPNFSHHFECGGEENAIVQRDMAEDFCREVREALVSLRLDDRGHPFRPEQLPEFCWEKRPEGRSWAYPPLRSLAQTDSFGYDLSVFFVSLQRHLSTIGGDFIDVRLCFPAYRFSHDYLWFNAPALGEAILTLLRGMIEKLKDGSGSKVTSPSGGARVFSVVVEEVFRSRTSQSGGLRFRITQIVNTRAHEDAVYDPSGSEQRNLRGFKYLPVPENPRKQNTLGRFWSLLIHAGVTCHEHQESRKVLSFAIPATPLQFADFRCWDVSDLDRTAGTELLRYDDYLH